MSVDQIVQGWTDDDVRTEATPEHPSGDLDRELEQLRNLESLVQHLNASCTNGTAVCSGGVCCL